jgi:hypothetical protein
MATGLWLCQTSAQHSPPRSLTGYADMARDLRVCQTSVPRISASCASLGASSDLCGCRVSVPRIPTPLVHPRVFSKGKRTSRMLSVGRPPSLLDYVIFMYIEYMLGHQAGPRPVTPGNVGGDTHLTRPLSLPDLSYWYVGRFHYQCILYLDVLVSQPHPSFKGISSLLYFSWYDLACPPNS